VSKLKGILELSESPDGVAAACRRIFSEMGWATRVDDGALIVAEEDAVRLSCRRLPAKSRLRIEPGACGGSTVEIETEVPGIGPISSTHARNRHLTVVRRIYAVAASGVPSSSSSRATVSAASR
jgi:hypothetical protein